MKHTFPENVQTRHKDDVAVTSWSTFESQAEFDYTPRHARQLPASLHNHYLLISGLPGCSLKSKLY